MTWNGEAVKAMLVAFVALLPFAVIGGVVLAVVWVLIALLVDVL
jgi:hypothetical protein